MATGGAGNPSEYSSSGTPEAAMAACDAQIGALRRQGVPDHEAQIRQIAEDLGVVLDQPGRSRIEVLQEACVARQLVLWYDAEYGFFLRLGDTSREATQEAHEPAAAEGTGHYLCEMCFDAMTDAVLAAAESPTGMEMALCQACRRARTDVPGRERLEAPPYA